MKATKQALAAAARERGEKMFAAVCKTHGTTDHYSSNGRCAACAAANAALQFERECKDPAYRERRSGGRRAALAIRMESPEYRETRNAYARERMQTLYTTSADHRGRQREATAAKDWRESPSGTETRRTMPASYETERPALQAFYAAVPKDFHADHLTPKVGNDHQGTRVASGLHVLGNIRAVPAKLNAMKATYFDPDNFREQRPLNAFPGGSGDPELTEQEWARVELLVRRYGEDRDATVASIQAQIAEKWSD